MKIIPQLPVKAYKAVFTPEGRQGVRYRWKRRRAHRSASFQQEGTYVHTLKNGNRFVLHQGNNLSELIYLEGAYEPLETLMVAKMVQAGDVVLDVGANVGYFTAMLDELVKPDGQVHSFEPGPGTFESLTKTKRLLKLDRTSLHQKAISDQVGTIDFFLSTSGSDAQQSTKQNSALGKDIRKHTVATTSLDAHVVSLDLEGGRTVAFVKCDIEGAEVSMTRGAKGLLTSANPPIWMVEHNRIALSEHGTKSEDLVGPFAGYDIYYVPIIWPPTSMVSRQAAKWNGVAADLPDECNLIILPRTGKYASRAGILRAAGFIG